MLILYVKNHTFFKADAHIARKHAYTLYGGCAYCTWKCIYSMKRIRVYPGIPGYTILCYSILLHAILSYSMLFSPIPCYSLLFHAILSHSMLLSPILCYSLLIPCYSLLFYDILSYSTLFSPIPLYLFLFHAILSRGQLPHTAGNWKQVIPRRTEILEICQPGECPS